MANKKWRALWVILLIVLITIISILNRQTYFVSLWLWLDNFFMWCGDFGQYVSETRDYLMEGVKLIEIMEVGKEPLLFIITSTLGRVTWLGAKESYVIIFSVIKILIVLTSCAIMMRKKQTWFWSMIFWVILCLTIVDSSSGFGRQTLANMYIILFILGALVQKNINLRSGFIISIFLACCFLSHKIALLYTGVVLFYLTIKFLYYKNWLEFKKILLILVCAIILWLPFISIGLASVYEFISDYIQKYIKIKSGTQEILNSGSIDISKGVSLVPWSSPYPIINYIGFQWFLCILALASLKKIFNQNSSNKYSEIIHVFFFITVIHTLFDISFSNRMVLFLNLLIAVENWINGLFTQSRWIKIFTLSTVFFLCAYASFSKNFEVHSIKKLARRIDNDVSVKFFQENISSKKSLIISDHCGSEFAEQMNYTSYINYINLTYWNEKEQIKLWKTSFGNFSWQLNIFMKSIFQKNFAPSLLKDTDLFIIFWPNFVNKYRQQIIKKDPYFINSENVELIYANPDPNNLISYIYKVKNENLIYFDEVNYLDRTLGNNLNK